MKKTKEVAVQSIDLDNKTAGANICVISIDSQVFPCLRGFQSSTKSLKRKQEFIESVDQMKKTDLWTTSVNHEVNFRACLHGGRVPQLTGLPG